MFRLGTRYDFELDTVHSSQIRYELAGMALIDIGQFPHCLRRSLALPGRVFRVGTVILAGGGNVQCQQIP